MGRELQKKKNRSGVRKATQKPKNRTKSGKRKVNFLGNEIITENWDRSLTLQQNYERLGLRSKLNKVTGGVEKHTQSREKENTNEDDILKIPVSQRTTQIRPIEVRVERDPQTGNIVRVIEDDRSTRTAQNGCATLHDALVDSADEDSASATTSKGVVAQLEAKAEEEALMEAKRKRPRQQSGREAEWIESLVTKHGIDTEAMFRDRKLNPMQQSQGDIARRVKKWQAKHKPAS